jgi:hypothetical protein
MDNEYLGGVDTAVILTRINVADYESVEADV